MCAQPCAPSPGERACTGVLDERCPPDACRTAQQIFSRHSLVFSNVPGPADAVFLAGKEVVGMFAVYPNLIMQHICVSYNGKMFMNFVCDPDVVTAPETLATLYMDELRALATLHGVDPNDHTSPAPNPKPAAADAKKGGGGAAEMV